MLDALAAPTSVVIDGGVTGDREWAEESKRKRCARAMSLSVGPGIARFSRHTIAFAAAASITPETLEAIPRTLRISWPSRGAELISQSCG